MRKKLTRDDLHDLANRVYDLHDSVGLPLSTVNEIQAAIIKKLKTTKS